METVKNNIFNEAPIKRAVLSQIIPAIASQMIILVYNLADTYFVGLLNDPIQTAAVTISYPIFLMLTALSNLLGVGGASAIARALGRKEHEKAKQISSLSFWCGACISIIFSVIIFSFSSPLLMLCGAKADTIKAAEAYTKWTVVIGGSFAVLNTLLANLVRSEGGATHASIGVSIGGILNIALDPFFVLPQFIGLGAEGAAIATAISNAVVTLYFLTYMETHHRSSVLSAHPKLLYHAKEHIGTVFSIGLPSALQYALTVVAVAAQSRFVSDYHITEAVAALGIVKKLDQLPLYFSIGVANGLLPLLAFNYSAGNTKRRKGAFCFGTMISLGFSVCCLIIYEALAPGLVSLFIENTITVSYGAQFLRIMVTAMPMMSVCYPMIIQFQAMGKVKESLICSIVRKGVLDIPLLFILNAAFSLYGCMWAQPIVDTVSLVIAITLYKRTI